jgi:hypothetical protein
VKEKRALISKFQKQLDGTGTNGWFAAIGMRSGG